MNRILFVARPKGIIPNTYEKQSHIEAVLVNENIQIARADIQQATLLPGQLASIFKDSTTIPVSDIKVYVKTVWQRGKIIFYKAGISEIAEQLSCYFNVDIELQGDEITPHKYSATFTT
ncbi:MAG: DUF4974 domain-containing protein [Mediterranea sp.]|nr:DUF4974 domain-containing protein [Mediterranea sp.]